MGGDKVDYTPTEEVKNASKIMENPEKAGSSVINPSDDPNIQYTKIKTVISRLGKDAETYLENNL